MKNLALVLIATLALAGCKKDPETPPVVPEITVDPTEYRVRYDKSTLQITVNSTVDFDVFPSASWLRRDTMVTLSENKFRVDFAVDSNSGKSERSANVTFIQKDGDLRQAVRVTQEVYRLGTIQEFMAYRHLFTSDVFGELIPGLPEDSITGIQNDLIRNIAMKLYRGEYPKEFRVASYKPFLPPSVTANRNKHRTLSLLDNPTGMAVSAGEDFMVFVGAMLPGQSLKMRVIDFTEGYGYGASVDYILTTGFNRFPVTNKGLAYIIYHTENPAAQPIDVHFLSGEENGYFDINKHTLADWTRLLNAAKDPNFDVIGKYSQLIFPVTNFKAQTSDPFVLMNVYDSIVFLEEEHLGLYKYNRTNPNKLLFHVDYDTWMYMSDNRTAYDISTMPYLCNAARLRSDWIWGPAHEAGHIFQTEGLNWVGMGEVSNNIMSMYVQTALGNEARLLEVSGGKNDYQRGADSIAAEARHATLTVFVKLVPFWQLELYFGKAQHKPDFYKDVYEKMRTTVTSGMSQGEKQLNFVKVCCDAAQLNLFDFFEAWGFLRTIDMEVEDYSSGNLTVTQEMIDEMRTYLEQYPDPAHNEIWRITDKTVDNYR